MTKNAQNTNPTTPDFFGHADTLPQVDYEIDLDAFPLDKQLEILSLFTK